MKIYVVDSDEGTRSMLLYVLGEHRTRRADLKPQIRSKQPCAPSCPT